MTDYAPRHHAIRDIEADKAIVRVQFTPNRRLAGALGRFSVSGSPIRLYTDRLVELDYHGMEYTPGSRQRLSQLEDQVIPVASRGIKLASHVLLRELSAGSLGVGLKLMPSVDVTKRLGEFARDSNGDRTDYVDVHAIIPLQDRVSDGVGFNLAVSKIEELLMTNDPALHPPGVLMEVPHRQDVSVSDARVVSRNRHRHHLH